MSNEHVTVKGLAHVGIRVHDAARSQRFYEVFGFVKTAGPMGPENVVILEHPSGLEINLVVNAPNADAENVLMDLPAKEPGYTHIALLVPSLDEAQARLKQAGIALSGGPIQFGPGARGVFVRDPDRNVLELHERTPK